MVCSVNYKTLAGDRKFFRKFYKFQVFKPLDVKTKAYNIDADVFLEVQVQNITSNPMYLQSVALQPNPLFRAVDLNTVKPASPDVPAQVTFGNSSYINPQVG